MAKIPNTDQTTLQHGCGAMGMFIRGNGTWYNHFANSLTVSYRTQYSLTIQISKHTPRCLPN